jgi:hypothetical protein
MTTLVHLPALASMVAYTLATYDSSLEYLSSFPGQLSDEEHTSSLGCWSKKGGGKDEGFELTWLIAF